MAEIILVTIIILGCAFLVYEHYKYVKLNNKKISFKESLDLTDLPVITLSQGDKKFNFLLDTGSNDSILSKSASRKLKGTYADCHRTIEGLGSVNAHKACLSTLQYKNCSFDVEFLVSEGVTEAFNSIKKATGVTIHGILGTKFLQKYSYIIDFNELVAYTKK